MKLFYLLFFCIFLLPLEKNPLDISASEQISLLDAISYGNFKVHHSCIEFPHFIKRIPIIYFKYTNEVHHYLRNLLNADDKVELKNIFFIHRYKKFARQNPRFRVATSSEEKIKEFLELYQYAYVRYIQNSSDVETAQWLTLLTALKNNDMMWLKSMKKIINNEKKYYPLVHD